MRNLKKLLAVILTICVLATAMVPAFAETKSESDICADLGVILGTGSGVTAEYLASQPDRLQGAIMYLRLKGLEAEAIAFTGTDNFSDAEGLSDANKAILAYLKAHPELGFVGIGDNKFAPTEKMSAKEYYKVLLTALGYTYGTEDTADFDWSTVFSFAASKGLIKLVDNDTFTIDDLCIGTVEALKLTVKGGTDTLITTLVDGGNIAADKAVASGLYTTTAKALEVVSATADNLKTAKVVFNKELDSTTITAANFKNADVTAAPTLLDDKKTVIVVFATKKAQSATADIVIANVKSTDGVTITSVTKTVTFVDTTIPAVTGVVAKNAKTLVISSSEPMMYTQDTPQPLSSIKIDGNVAFGTTVVDSVKNTITVSLYNYTMATGTRTVAIADLTDYAGYKAVAQSFNVEVVEDKTAPVLVSAKMVTSTELEATFDEELSAVGTFTVVGVTTTTATAKTDKTKVKLALSNALGIGAIVEIKITYVDQQDVMANKVATAATYTFKVEDDTALPTVTAAIAGKNVITLTFSKPMAQVGTIKILKASDSTAIAGVADVNVATTAFKADTNNTVLVLPAIDGKDPLDIKVNIKNMTDASIRSNPLGEQNLALKFLDTKNPVVQPFYKLTPGATVDKDYVTFYFDEAMNVDSIKALANYLIAGVPLSSYGTNASLKEVASDAKSVSFYINNISATPGTAFQVYAVLDVAGNMQPVTNVANLTGMPAFTVVSAKATAKNKVEVEFTNNLGTLDYTGFSVKLVGGATVYAKAATLKTPTQASIELWSSDVVAGTSGAAVELVAAKIKNAYGTTLTGPVTTALVDGIKPTATVATGTTAGTITVSFDEEIVNTNTVTVDSLSVYKSGIVNVTYTFLDANGAAVAAGANFKTVVITGVAALESGASYTVIVNANGLIKDVANNAATFVNTTAAAK